MKTKFHTISSFSFLIIIFFIQFSHAQTFETTVVGTETLSTRPVIFADSLGNLHVAWTSGTNTGQDLNYSTNQSGEWSYSRKVAGSSNDQAYVPVIVADNYGFAYIAARFYSLNFYIKYVTNKNLTAYNWSAVNKMNYGHYHEASIEIESDGSVHTFAEEDNLDAGHIYLNNLALADTILQGGDQLYSTTIDQDDNLHLAGVRSSNVFYTKYSLGSWSTPVAIDQLETGSYHPSITCDQNGKIHVAFATASGTIYYLNNTSGSWLVPIATTGSGIFPDVVIDENGKAHIAYYTQVENGNLNYMNNTSGSWNTPVFIATINTDVSPATEDAAHVDSKIAIDPKSNTVNIVYVQNGNQVTVATTDDVNLRGSKSTDITTTLTRTSGTATIDTLTTSDATSTQTLLEFTITDVTNDGQPTTIESIVFQRGPGMSDNKCFNDLFASMTIEEVGQSSEAVSLYSSKAIIGTQGSTWKTISEGGSKSFILKGVLNSSLTNLIGNDFQIKVNGLHDVIINKNGSLFSYSNIDILSDTLRIRPYALSGAGTEVDPYIIANLDDLRGLSEGNSYWESYIKQTADIDASATSTWNSGYGFYPIGTLSTTFTGTYDGNGKTISNLYMNYPGIYYGFIGSINGGSIQKLGLVNINITANIYTGSLAGYVVNSSINYCYSSGSVNGSSTAGGLIGGISTSNISNSYSTATVNGDTGLNNGGLVGYVTGTSQISNCFSTGSVSGGGNNGGLVGRFFGTINVTNSFWNTTTSGQASSDGGTGKSTAEMKDWATFSDSDTDGLSSAWDFAGDPNDDSGTNDYWSIDGSNNDGYPWLTWEGYSPATNTWDGSESTNFVDKDNWSLGFVPNLLNNVVVNSGGNQPEIASNQSPTINNLTVNSGANLTIKSDATNNGSLIVNGTSTGDVNYNRWMTKDKWHLVAAPVGGQTIDNFITINTTYLATSSPKYGLALYNNSTPGWEHYTTSNTAGSFIAGKGYETMRKTSDGTFTFTGTIPTADVSIGITKNSNAWNLIGNPFPSAINVNDDAHATNNFLTVNTADLDPSYLAIYVWDAPSSSYLTVNHNYLSNTAFYASPGQAFFVYSTVGGSTVDFTEVMQTHQTGDIFKGGEMPTQKILLTAECSKGTSSTNIKYIKNMTTGLDPGHDAGRFSAGGNSFAIYTQLVGDKTNTVDFDIQCLPANEYEHIIPIGLNAPENTEVLFRAETMNLPASTPVYIEDRINEKFADLTENGSFYSVNISEKSEGTGRFFLHTQKTALTNIDSLSKAIDITIITRPQNNDIRIIGQVGNKAQLAVYDVAGRKLIDSKLTNAFINDIEMAGFKSGIYLIHISSSSLKTCKKISWIQD